MPASKTLHERGFYVNQTPATPDSPGMSDLQRVHELLPWYALGTLVKPELLFVTQWLEHNAQARPAVVAELAWLRTTSEQLRQSALTAKAPADAGLAALMARIGQESLAHAPGQAPAQAPAALHQQGERASMTARTNPNREGAFAPTFVDRISAWLSHALGLHSPVLAFSVVALVLAQSTVIGLLLMSAPATQVPLGGAVQAGAADNAVVLTVAFNPRASEADIRAVLTSAGAQVVAGPSALGLYRLAVPPDKAVRAAELLGSARGVVESVQRQ